MALTPALWNPNLSLWSFGQHDDHLNDNSGKSIMMLCRYAYSFVRTQLRSELCAYPASAYSCMRIRPPHMVAVCVGVVHMIFSGSSKGTHTALLLKFSS